MAIPSSSPHSCSEQIGSLISPSKLPPSKMASIASDTSRLPGPLSVLFPLVEGPALLIGGDGDPGRRRVRFWGAGTLGWPYSSRCGITYWRGSRRFTATDNKVIVVVIFIALSSGLLSTVSLFAVSPSRSLFQSMSRRASHGKA